MRRSGSPEFDPYFSPVPKEDSKGEPSGEEEIRRDLLPIEVAFHVAGTVGIVLSGVIFIIFAVPVSRMLREAGEPDGILSDGARSFHSWAAFMAAIFALAILGVVTSLGVRRRRSWARWALIGLGSIPPLELIVGLVIWAWDRDIDGGGLFLIITHPLAGAFVYPASYVAFRAACSRRGRAVFNPQYDEVVARTPKLAPEMATGLQAGAGLALAMFFLHWMALVMILFILALLNIIPLK